KELDLDELIKLVLPYLQEKGYVSENLSDEENAHYQKLISLYQEQMSYAAQLPEVAGLFFDQEINWSDSGKEVLAGETVPEVLTTFKAELSALPSFEASE